MLLAVGVWATRPPDSDVAFETYYAAATRVLTGSSPYQADGAFAHLPVVALLLTPLGFLGPEAARALWFTVSAGLLTGFVRWSIHGLPERRRGDEWLQWLVVVVLAPVFSHQLLAGDLTLLVGALLVASLLAVQVDLVTAGGILLALAILLGPHALLLVPWLALARGRMAVVALGTVLGVALLGPALVFGWTRNLQLLATWSERVSDSAVGSVTFVQGVSVGAMWTTWLGATQLAGFLAVLTVTALLGLVATAWVRRKAVYEPDYLEVALVLAVVPLLSAPGHSWLFVLATPAVVILLDRWNEVSRSWQAAAAAAMAAMALGSAGSAWPLGNGHIGESGVLALAGIATVFALANLRRKTLA